MLLVEKHRQTARTSRGDSGKPITIGDLCDKYAEKTLDDFTLTQKGKYARFSALKRLATNRTSMDE
tara:strand:- start:6332 stop:6529 length:198 start_codon:yes stop_codon:yes gene_type:complete